MTPFPADDRASQQRLRVGVASVVLHFNEAGGRAPCTQDGGTLLFSIKGHALPVVTSWGACITNIHYLGLVEYVFVECLL